MPGSVRALPRFSATPHSSQKNSSKIRRNCAGERKALSRRRSESGGGKCVSRMAVQRSGILSRRRMCSGRQSSSGASASSTRCMMVRSTRVVSFADGLVDGHDAAHVQRGFAIVVVAGEDFEFGVQHGELAGVGVELHLAEERHLHALGAARWRDSRRGTICPRRMAREASVKRGFEHPQVAALEAGELAPSALRRSRWPFRRARAGPRSSCCCGPRSGTARRRAGLRR